MYDRIFVQAMPYSETVTFDDFQDLVEEAVLSLPDEIKAMMENVAVTTARSPSPAQRQSTRLGPHQALYGLYQGVPLTRRTTHYGMVPPDRITIFMYPMVNHHRTPESIRNQVRRTVLHEIGHHFGMDEDHIRRLGY